MTNDKTADARAEAVELVREISEVHGDHGLPENEILIAAVADDLLVASAHAAMWTRDS